jgi:alpha-1,2-mannosyltransferase
VSVLLVVLTTAWIVAPVAVRHGWRRWVALGVAIPLAFAMEPVRETLGWGQIDLLIAALVLADVGALRRRRPWAGVGIGLATAIKVTPGLFIVYLMVTRRWRAAALASGTFGVTVLVGFGVEPSMRYWTALLWQTDRVGSPTNPNDQSLLGLLARLPGVGPPNRVLWSALVVLVLVGGLARAAQLSRRGDDLAGVTVTGLTACLISPIAWVHHLYWVIPAVVVLVDVAAGTPIQATCARRHPLAVQRGAAAAALLVTGAFACSVIWFFTLEPPSPWTVAGENAYVLLMLALVAGLPARTLAVARTGAEPVAAPRPARL